MEAAVRARTADSGARAVVDVLRRPFARPMGRGLVACFNGRSAIPGALRALPHRTLHERTLAEPSSTPARDAPVCAPATRPRPACACSIDCRLAYQLEGDCEFVFLIHVALDRGQSLVEETVHIEPPLPYRSYTDEHSGNRFMRLSAGAGALTVSYHAVVDRLIDAVDPNARGSGGARHARRCPALRAAHPLLRVGPARPGGTADVRRAARRPRPGACHLRLGRTTTSPTASVRAMPRPRRATCSCSARACAATTRTWR